MPYIYIILRLVCFYAFNCSNIQWEAKLSPETIPSEFIIIKSLISVRNCLKPFANSKYDGKSANNLLNITYI